MDLTAIEGLGLSKSEVKAYLALLELGKTSAGPIVKSSGISQSKIYEVLERLGKKGLASHIIEGKIKYFTPAEPKRLISFSEEKKDEL